MRMERFFILLLLGLFVATQSGCVCGQDAGEKVAEKAIERAIKTETGHDAEVDLGGDVDLSDLPKFLRYPGAKGLARMSGGDESGSGTVVNLESGDSVDDVISWYKKSLTDAGWAKAAYMEMGEGTMLNYVSPDEKEGVNVTINKDKEKGKTIATIILASQ